MKNQFVTYEIALKLKELGFNEECFAAYGKNERFVYCHQLTEGTTENTTENFNMFKGTFFNTSAPLWQQVIDWFRIKHNITIEPSRVKGLNVWHYYVWNIAIEYKNQDFSNIMPPSAFNFYEEAREAAILKAIEMIENDRK